MLTKPEIDLNSFLKRLHPATCCIGLAGLYTMTMSLERDSDGYLANY